MSAHYIRAAFHVPLAAVTRHRWPRDGRAATTSNSPSRRWLSTIDKASFTLGVVGLLVTQFVATEHPSVFRRVLPRHRAGFAFSHRAARAVLRHQVPLLPHRFCYYANARSLAHILAWPTLERRFFKTTFAYANGPPVGHPAVAQLAGVPLAR